MAQSVKRYVRSCDSCQRNKPSNQRPLGLLTPLRVPTDRWEQITMDFIVQLPRTNQGYDSIVVFVDRLSKRVHLAPTTTTASAVEIARIFFDVVFRHHGLPATIISDRDPKFTSRFWKTLFSLLGTRISLSTAFHPETDGQTERMNRTLEDMLRALVNYRQNDWDTWLTAAEFAINNSKQSSTGFSPFYLDTGRTPIITGPLTGSTTTPSQVAFADKFIEEMRSALRIAKDALLKAQDHQMEYANKKRRPGTFNVGDLVLLSSTNICPNQSTQRPSKKLLPKYLGPFKVEQKVSSVTYKLNLPPSMRIHPVFHISLLKPYHANPTDFPDRTQSPPPPIYVDDSDTPEFEVEFILDKRCYRRQTQYLVKWAGYPEHDATWVPISNLKNAREAITEFERSSSGMAIE
jgi:hypothetical protein